MRYARALIPTLKEAPSDATRVSHVRLLRAGYARRIGAGIYAYLPLGLKVLRKIERIVRDELDKAGALELLLPALLPAEYFQETGRWQPYGDVLLRLKDRKGGDYHLGPTHEEIITDPARREIKSYRDLPKNLYQVQTKRVTLGKKSLENGGAELKLRRAKDPKQSEIVGLDRAAAQVFELVQQALRVSAAGEAA